MCSAAVTSDSQNLVDPEATTKDPFNGLKPGSQISRDSTLWGLSTVPTFSPEESSPMSRPSESGESVDCTLSRWTPWSHCSVTCGRGFRTKTRYVKVKSAQTCQGLKPVKTCQGVKPVQTCHGVKPVQTCQGVKPVQTCQGVKPVKACQGVKPVKACQGVKPVQTCQGVKPVQTCQGVKPVKTCQGVKSAQTCQGVKPVQTCQGTYPKNGGKDCPKKLLRRKKCKLDPCDPEEQQDIQTPSWEPYYMPPPGSTDEFPRVVIDCELSEWTPWSSCSMSCGSHAVRQRTRSIIAHPSQNGLQCGNRLETEPCKLLPCKA
uniref:Spondin-like TSP1 domain-containing protein n=1 Tax=Timema poppense TaxID=170557 RepID=A0A7R9H6D3_TIMPO|nr:unnamed protein product [Timema poppensis]